MGWMWPVWALWKATLKCLCRMVSEVFWKSWTVEGTLLSVLCFCVRIMGELFVWHHYALPTGCFWPGKQYFMGTIWLLFFSMYCSRFEGFEEKILQGVIIAVNILYLIWAIATYNVGLQVPIYIRETIETAITVWSCTTHIRINMLRIAS